MSKQTVTARLGKEDDSPSAEVEYDFGDNLEEAVEKFGAEVVYGKFKAASVVDLQGWIRNRMRASKAEDEEKRFNMRQLQPEANKWAPSLKEPGKDKVEKAADLFSSMTPEQRADALKALQAATKASK